MAVLIAPPQQLWIVTVDHTGPYPYGEIDQVIVWARTKKKAKKKVVDYYLGKDRTPFQLHVEAAPTSDVVLVTQYPS